MEDEAGFHAWNPGLASGLPRHVRPLATVFRPENVETGLAESEELSDCCGLPASRLSMFRAERLVVHEVLVRVMADLSIPLGSVYADLGVNFRRIVATILREGIEAHLPEIRDELRAIRDEADGLLRREIALLLDGPVQAAAPARTPSHWLDRLPFGRRTGALPPRQEPAPRDPDEAAGEPGSLHRAVHDALQTLAASLVARQGYLPRNADLLRRIGAILVSNGFGSRRSAR